MVDKDPLAVRLIVDPIALINIAVRVDELALAIGLVIVPEPFVYGPVCPLLSAEALSLFILPLSVVDGAISHILGLPARDLRQHASRSLMQIDFLELAHEGWGHTVLIICGLGLAEKLEGCISLLRLPSSTALTLLWSALMGCGLLTLECV